MVKFVSFEDIDTSLITISGLCGISYGAHFLCAPKHAHRMYYEASTPGSTTYEQWFGASLVGQGSTVLNQNNVITAKKKKKDVLKLLGVYQLGMACLQAHHMHKGGMKKEYGFPSLAVQAGLSTACFVRGFATDDAEE
eukprot:jgi/Picsp_1/1976/NSC_05442-R1_---NA---